MSVDDKTIQQLMSFGLTEYEARVYVTLTQKGPQKASVLALASGISRPHIYATLKELREKGLIAEIPKKVVEYRAQPATDTLRMMLEKRKRSIEELEVVSKELTQKLETKDKALEFDGEKVAPMRVYQGHWNIINAMREMLSKARTSCDFVTNKPDDAHFIIQVYDREISELKKRGIKPRILIPVNSDNLAVLDNISSSTAVKHIDNLDKLKDLEISEAERGFGDLHLRVLIVDGSDAAFVMSDMSDNDERAYYTKQKEAVNITKLVYFNVWNGACDIAYKKAEIENGVRPESVMSISGDMNFASTANGILSRASSSAYGNFHEHQFIYNLGHFMLDARDLISRGVTVKVMVDINSDISTAIKIFKDTGAEIRHYPGSNMTKVLMSDSEAIVYVIDENLTSSDSSNLGIYVNQQEAMSRLISQFEREWAMAIDADDRIKQLKSAGK